MRGPCAPSRRGRWFEGLGIERAWGDGAVDGWLGGWIGFCGSLCLVRLGLFIPNTYLLSISPSLSSVYAAYNTFPIGRVGGMSAQ